MVSSFTFSKFKLRVYITGGWSFHSQRFVKFSTMELYFWIFVSPPWFFHVHTRPSCCLNQALFITRPFGAYQSTHFSMCSLCDPKTYFLIVSLSYSCASFVYSFLAYLRPKNILGCRNGTFWFCEWLFY